MTYLQFITRIADLLRSPDINYTVAIPAVIDAAEQRCYRDLDLLATVVRDTGTLSTGTRTFTLPSALGRFVVTNGCNVITPASAASADAGTRNPLHPVSRDVLDTFWPSTTGAGVPTMYAMITDQIIIVGPAPGSAYKIEIIGTIRPTPLSSANSTTYLTLYLPDLFLASAMMFMVEYMDSVGIRPDPQQQMWPQEYTNLLNSSNIEEQRKRYAAGAWGSLSPTPIATPPR